MADREKVIKSLKWFRDRDSWREGIMIHDDHAEVRKRICDNAIALLKEQEAVEPLTIDDAVSEIMDKHYKRLKEQDADKPKGHWMPYEPDKRGYTDGFICSRCERVILSDHYCKMIDFDFCPYCGAYMDNAEGL